MNGAGAPTVGAGRGVSAAVAATGVLTITLPVSFQSLIGYGFYQGQGTVADTYQKLTAYSVDDRTVTISNFAGGGTTATAFQAAATYNEISFWVEVQPNSSSAT